MRQLPGPLILQGALLIAAAALPWGRGIAETPAIKSQAAVAMMPPSALAARTLSASRDRRTMAARTADSVIVWRDGEPEVPPGSSMTRQAASWPWTIGEVGLSRRTAMA